MHPSHLCAVGVLQPHPWVQDGHWVLFMGSCQLVFLGGQLKSGTAYVTLLMNIAPASSFIFIEILNMNMTVQFIVFIHDSSIQIDLKKKRREYLLGGFCNNPDED